MSVEKLYYQETLRFWKDLKRNKDLTKSVNKKKHLIRERPCGPVQITAQVYFLLKLAVRACRF